MVLMPHLNLLIDDRSDRSPLEQTKAAWPCSSWEARSLKTLAERPHYRWVLDCSSQGILLLAEVTTSGSLHPTNGFITCRWRVLQMPRLRSPWVSQDIQVYQEMLTSCENAPSQSVVLKLITALVESKTVLLQKEARLAGTAAGELWGSNRAAAILLHVWHC